MSEPSRTEYTLSRDDFFYLGGDDVASARSSILVYLLVALAVAGAQQTGGHAVQPGSISGEVLCADTQRPARLAKVELVRVPSAFDVPKPGSPRPSSNPALVSQTAQTTLDGTYTLGNVKPGSYYVVVDQPGYLLPLGGFSVKDLAQPDASTRDRLHRSVHTITVRSGELVKEDVVLRRGASLNGSVTYDDGSPAPGIPIEVLSKDNTGKWASLNLRRYRSFVPSQTDEDGRYHITGLEPGEYAVQANFSRNQEEQSSGPMPGNPKVTVDFTFSKTVFSLPLFSGSVLRKSEAKAYAVTAAAAQDGIDLVFPLSKLHRVSGEVLAQDGHALNGGKVEVLYADDKSSLTEAPVSEDGSGFHLDFVPEGTYVLKVSDARDVTSVEVANPKGYSPAFHEEPKTVKTYGDSEQSLVVQSDLSNVVVSVPDAAHSSNASAATQ